MLSQQEGTYESHSCSSFPEANWENNIKRYRIVIFTNNWSILLRIAYCLDYENNLESQLNITAESKIIPNFSFVAWSCELPCAYYAYKSLHQCCDQLKMKWKTALISVILHRFIFTWVRRGIRSVYLETGSKFKGVAKIHTASHEKILNGSCGRKWASYDT